MCGIAGFFNPSADYTKEKNYRNHILEMMNQVQKHRGPDDEGTFLSPQCGLAHVRLNIIDLVTGHQPMRRVRGDHSCVIAYNGEIYNAPELKAELISEGEQFLTSGDTEVILAGFMRCGPSFIKKLNGIFAIALWDESCQTLHLFRDRLGVKPLFYTKKDERKNRAPHIHPNYQLVYRSRHARKTIECPRNGKRSIRDKLKACWRQSFCTGKHTEKICMVGPDCGNLYGKRPCKFQRLT